MPPLPGRCPPSLGLSAAILMSAAAFGGCDVKVGDKGMSVGVARETLQNEWVRTYRLASGRFELSLAGGTIEVSATDAPQLEVRVMQEASAMTKEAARQALDSVSIQETAAVDHVSVDVRSKTADGLRGRVSIRAIVRLPHALTSVLNVRDGEIRLEGVDGTTTAAVTNGTVFGHGLGGALSASALNGRLSVEFARITAPTALTVRNGNVNLGLPVDAKADIEAMVLNGRINVDSPLQVASDTPRSDGGRRGFLASDQLNGRLNGGGPRITIQATNGAVRISPPGSVPAPRQR